MGIVTFPADGRIDKRTKMTGLFAAYRKMFWECA